MTREISCQEASRYVFRYLDGELEPATEAELENHLRQCRKCLGVVEFERQVIEFVKRNAGAVENTPRGLRERIERLLSDEPADGEDR